MAPPRVAVVILLVACGGLPAPDPGRPDLILVSVDSLRPDHLGAWGNPRQPSPGFDALAASGLRFSRARSASPWTLPSHTTMLSGRWPTDHGVIEDNRAIPASLPWIPSALQGAGWATGGFVSTVYVSREFGFERGFDHFEDFGITKKENLGRPVRAEDVVDEALGWARKAPDGAPIFLFVHLYDVHYPYLPPEPYNTRYDKAGTRKSTAYRTWRHYLAEPLQPARLEHLRAQYDECVAYTDAQLARLKAAWTRPATWILLSDHGEELGEHGSWGHGHTLHPEVLDIPLIVAGPGVAPAVRTERAGTIDVAATLAALAGLSWEGPGVDLRGPVPERAWIEESSRFDTARLGLLDGGRRLDVDLRGERRLYDLAADPAELRPLPGDPALERKLLEALPEAWTATGPVRTEGWTYQGGAWVTAPTGRFGLYPADAEIEGARTEADTRAVSVSAEVREQLEALGYQQ